MSQWIVHRMSVGTPMSSSGWSAISGFEVNALEQSLRESSQHDDPDGAVVILDADLERIQAWIDTKNESIPEHVREQIGFEIETTNRTVTILECRPPWSEDLGPEWTRLSVARLRYTQTKKEWSLYWSDQHGRFHEYDLIRPTRHVSRLLTEIDSDPTAIFWG